jgi:hypothetical protein
MRFLGPWASGHIASRRPDQPEGRDDEEPGDDGPGEQGPEAHQLRRAAVEVRRVALWRKSDLRTTTLVDAAYPEPVSEEEPAVVKVELTQRDKRNAGQTDAQVLVVELGQA